MKDRPEIGERNEEKGRRATTAMRNIDTIDYGLGIRAVSAK